MLFSGEPKKDEDKAKGPKKRSTLGFLFNPNFGADVTPLVGALAFFPRMLAMVFCAYRLFPKDHPAFDDNVFPLSVREVLAQAWNRLSFTRGGIPQILVFIAIVGAVVFSAFFILSIFLSLIVGSAHAQGPSGGMFTLDDDSCDLAKLWLDFLFLGGKIQASSCGLNTTDVIIAPSGKGLQLALSAALSFFSKAVLVCAGFLLLFHLTVMIAESAHTGKPMGRANQIWAPVRLVLAIAFLVPIASLNNTSLNAGQHLVLNIAKWGSALATNTWNTIFEQAISQEGLGTLNLAGPPPQDVVSVTNDIILMKACQYANNAYLSAYANGSVTPNDLENGNIPGDMEEYAVVTPNNPLTDYCPGEKARYEGSADDMSVDFDAVYYPSMCKYYSFSSKNNKISCGKFLVPDFDKDKYQLTNYLQKIGVFLHGAHLNAINALFNSAELRDAARGVVLGIKESPYRDIFAEQDLKLTNDDFYDKRNKAIDFYRKTLKEEIEAIAEELKYKSQDIEDIQKWQAQGWVVAGAWFNTIVRAQNAIFSGAESSLPVTQQPFDGLGVAGFNWWDRNAPEYMLGTSTKKMESLKGVGKKTQEALAYFKAEIIDKSYTPGRKAGEAARAGLASDLEMPEGSKGLKGFLWAVNKIGANTGAWGSSDSLIIQFGKSSNPLAEIAQFGYRQLDTGLTIIAWAGIGGAISKVGGAFLSSIPVAGTSFKLAGAMIGLAFFIGIIFVTTGVMLTYMVPLLPFIKFLFNVLTWILIVFEAIVSLPLFALAHVSPYGDGMPGQASRGYMLLLSLLLRPVLLVIGLIAGFLFFFVAVNFLNMTFAIASEGSGQTAGSLSVISRLVFSTMYAVFVYICANKCFQTISYFPDSVMEWFGGASLKGRPMGDKQLMTAATAAVVGYAGKEGLEKASEALSGMGTALSDSVEGRSKNRTQKRRDQIETDRHDDNMRAQDMIKGQDGRYVKGPSVPQQLPKTGRGDKLSPTAQALSDRIERTNVHRNAQHDPAGSEVSFTNEDVRPYLSENETIVQKDGKKYVRDIITGFEQPVSSFMIGKGKDKGGNTGGNPPVV